MLETVLNRSFSDMPIDSCIDEFFRCVEPYAGEGIHRRDKARASAYLATKDKPNVSVGVAAKKGYWNLDHEAFAPIRDFMRGLCAA